MDDGGAGHCAQVRLACAECSVICPASVGLMFCITTTYCAGFADCVFEAQRDAEGHGRQPMGLPALGASGPMCETRLLVGLSPRTGRLRCATIKTCRHLQM